jgi:hypothetical protein
MEIQLYKQNLPYSELANMPKRELEVMQALNSRMLKDTPDFENFIIFKNCIVKAYLISRFTSPVAGEVTVLIDETAKSFKKNLGTIREDEVPILFERGISKEYGDYMGLGFISFVDWGKAYIKDQARIKLTTPIKETKIPSIDEIYQISKSNALEAFKEFKSKGTCGRFASVVYQFLLDQKIVYQTKEERIEYWNQAKQEYSEYLNTVMANPVDMDEKKKIQKDYQSFLEGGKQDRLIIISRRLVVDDYFRGLEMESIELETVLK